MKPLTDRIAHKEFERLWVNNLREKPLFDSKSILWQMNLPGVTVLAALRGLLRSAAVEQGEERFPYSQVADTLLRQQMAVFGGWRTPWQGKAEQWQDGLLIDQGIRACIPKDRSVDRYSKEVIYREYLRFARIMGLEINQLPATPDAFKAWASSNEMVWSANDYRRKALECITNLSPVFWPVNIAVIFYLLPGDFWDVYGPTLGTESRRLAICAVQTITKLSCCWL
jgi:hypothetical protein